MGKVVVMVRHDPRAQRFADRVFSLTDGRIDALT
jgi:ABC-type lipoprotein export system ATPase subunit